MGCVVTIGPLSTAPTASSKVDMHLSYMTIELSATRFCGIIVSQITEIIVSQLFVSHSTVPGGTCGRSSTRLFKSAV